MKLVPILVSGLCDGVLWSDQLTCEVYSHRHLLVGMINLNFILSFDCKIKGPFILQDSLHQCSLPIISGSVLSVNSPELRNVHFYPFLSAPLFRRSVLNHTVLEVCPL